mmetsp:Transcript_33385/g.85074  ORF Transcript_33385/g.85074 Transcript_33385/m.85074 type:complete len:441 (-) Transcript_33385:93-1415(-)
MASSKSKKHAKVVPDYVTLNKDGKPVWEPGLRAEVTSRRKPQIRRERPETEEAPVSCDLKNTLKLTPSERATWLDKALSAIPKGKAKAQEVFDIVTHRKFASGVPEELGQQMLKQVKESLVFFSDKQQHNIAKSKLVREFKPSDPNRKRSRRTDSDDEASKSSDDELAPSSRRPERGGGREEERRHHEAPEARSDNKESDKDSPPPPPPEGELSLSPEERVRMERELAEREKERLRKREEELKRLELDKKAHEERERQRKAKIGNAFLVGGDDEDDLPPQPLLRPLVEKKAEDRLRVDDSGSSGLKYSSSSTGSSGTASVQHGAAIATMGGDSIVSEAQQILQRGAGAFLELEKQKRSNRSRSRRRRSQSRSHSSPSRSRKGPPQRARRPPQPGEERRNRTYENLRSPTPDGHLRGQMRAARKAKLMAQMLQQGNVPRIT